MQATGRTPAPNKRTRRSKRGHLALGTGLLALLLTGLPGCPTPEITPDGQTIGDSRDPADPGNPGNGGAGGGDARPEPSPPVTPDPVPPPPPQDGGNLPPGSLGIVTLGDSVTEGTGDGDGRGGYPTRLLDQVQQRRAGSSVLNLGRYGWTSGELLRGTDSEPGQLDAGIAAEPDIACVWIGSNDLWRLYEYGPPEGTSSADEAADLAAYTSNMDEIVRRLSEAGAAVFVGLMDDQSLRPVAQDRLTLPNTTAAEFVQMSAQVGRYNDAIRAVAQRYGATVVDFYNTNIFTSVSTLDFDGIHPNAAGYDQIADIWFAAIEPRLD